jgi:hypothetical protein
MKSPARIQPKAERTLAFLMAFWGTGVSAAPGPPAWTGGFLCPHSASAERINDTTLDT